jgi:hypothetical protein
MKEARKKRKKGKQIDPCTPLCTNLRGTRTSIMKRRKREGGKLRDKHTRIKKCTADS